MWYYHIYNEPLNYRTTSGYGSVNYTFVGNVVVCCIQDFTRESPVHDVYIFDKMLMILHSVSLDYLLTHSPSKSIVLDIPPYTSDKINDPIILTA